MGNFEILDSRRRIFLHFEVYFYFALLSLEVNQFEQTWKKKTEHLLKSIPEQCTNYRRKKKERDINVCPYNVLNERWEESLSSNLSYFDAGTKYSNNDHLLATINIHPKFPWISADAMHISSF